MFSSITSGFLDSNSLIQVYFSILYHYGAKMGIRFPDGSNINAKESLELFQGFYCIKEGSFKNASVVQYLEVYEYDLLIIFRRKNMIYQ